MRAMVTGGAGFIGSTLVDRLLAEGHDVEVVDDLSTGSLSNLESAQTAGSKFVFHHLDIRLPDMTELVMERRPQVIFHLAAQMDVRVSVERPVFDADINVIGTLRILEGARAAGCQRIVFAASGGTLYGEVDSADLPVVETHAHRPLSPYGVSKKAGIDYLVAFRELYGLSFYALALANVFGPRQDPHGEAGVVAIFAQRLVAGEPVTIYGDGEQTRDYVYVNDVVDAFVRAADRGDGGVRNIGTGHQTSVNELYRTMAQVAGSGAAPEYAPARRGDLKYNALSADLARQELGWEPATGLAEGTRAVIEFVRAQAK